MKLTKGVPCYACRPGQDWADFQRVLAQGDVGLTIYRYRETADKRPTGRATKETIIFYTTRTVREERNREMNLEIFAADLPKCANYCPRCREMMRRIETLFYNDPSTARGTDLCELFSCPPCTDIVNKLRTFAAETTMEKHDSELIHLQRLATPNYDEDVRSRSVLDDAAKAEVLKGAGMLKDKEGKNKDRENERGAAGTVKDLEGKNKEKRKNKEDAGTARTTKTLKEAKERTNELKKAASKIKKDEVHHRKDGKVRSSIDKASKDTERISADKEGSSSKMVKEQKKEKNKEEKEGMRKTASESKITLKETAQSSSKKELLSKPKSDVGRIGDKSDKNVEEPRTLPIIRTKIDEHMRAKLERERELEKKRKDIDDKMRHAHLVEEAARLARANAEKARQLKFKEAMQQIAISELESMDRSTDECAQDVEVQGIIKGNKILYKPHRPESVKQDRAPEASTVKQRPKSSRPPPRTQTAEKTSLQSSVPSRRDGVIRYNLSERKYVNKGWTQLPKEMVMRKEAVFLMRPARQDFDWLETNKPKGRVLYHSGEELATFDENGTRLYYKSGKLALEYYQAEETTAGERVVIYSSGKLQCGRARPRTVLAVFDYSGNGVVYDHTGKIRLKYSQTEGVVLDQTIGPHTHWKWHNLNDSPLLQTVLIENQPQYKDPKILMYKDDTEILKDTSADENMMKGIETHNIIKEKKRLLKNYAPFQIKMKAFKINECFSLRILEQNSIFLSFSDGKTHFKINVGMVLDPTVIIGEDYVEVGDVANSLEKPACSESMERLQRVVQGARGAERARVLHERRLNETPSYLMERHRKR